MGDGVNVGVSVGVGVSVDVSVGTSVGVGVRVGGSRVTVDDGTGVGEGSVVTGLGEPVRHASSSAEILAISVPHIAVTVRISSVHLTSHVLTFSSTTVTVITKYSFSRTSFWFCQESQIRTKIKRLITRNSKMNRLRTPVSVGDLVPLPCEPLDADDQRNMSNRPESRFGVRCSDIDEPFTSRGGGDLLDYGSPTPAGKHKWPPPGHLPMWA